MGVFSYPDGSRPVLLREYSGGGSVFKRPLACRFDKLGRVSLANSAVCAIPKLRVDDHRILDKDASHMDGIDPIQWPAPAVGNVKSCFPRCQPQRTDIMV